jgi:hypothetical protein
MADMANDDAARRRAEALAQQRLREAQKAAEKEAARLAKVAEDQRKAAEKEAARLAKVAEDQRKAAEKEAQQ